MIALLGGVGAALAWGVSTLCSARSSRLIRPASVVAWVALVGLAANVAVIAATREGIALSAADAGWMLAVGLPNVVGLLLSYTALRSAKVGLVAPIVSTEGAVAAVLAVVAGERLGTATAAVLGLIVAGIVIAAVSREELPAAGAHQRRAVGLALLAALSFGCGLYATARLGAAVPAGWAALPPRLVGVAVVTVPLAITGRLEISRRAVPLVVTAGVAEVAGFLAYVAGARHDVAVAAVLGSQFAALAGVAAFLLFRERLTRVQLGGVGCIVVGVAVLALLRAA
jgi:drug/metabolite transporter (DMT)-like permease